MEISIIEYIAKLDSLGKRVVRLAIVIVFLWIGGLKFFNYEAEGIVPFVANSPIMSFFYQHSEDYMLHQNKEGEFIAINHQWHLANNSYIFSAILGSVLIVLGILIATYQYFPLASIVIFLMTLVTLSFLFTTPESWIGHSSGTEWGFPYLSGRGRLVVKDAVILSAAIINMSESARRYLMHKKSRKKNLAIHLKCSSISQNESDEKKKIL